MKQIVIDASYFEIQSNESESNCNQGSCSQEEQNKKDTQSVLEEAVEHICDLETPEQESVVDFFGISEEEEVEKEDSAFLKVLKKIRW